MIRRQHSTATVTVELDPALRKELRRAAQSTGPLPSLRLTVVGVDPPAGPAMGVRVFINHPRADLDTPLEDPHFVGAFAFFPADAPGDQNFLLDPVPALRRLRAAGKWNSEEPLTVTLVAFAQDANATPPDAVIRFEKATLE